MNTQIFLGTIMVPNIKKTVDELFLKNDIIFDIDWQGTQQLSKFKNLNLVKIFIIPPIKMS